MTWQEDAEVVREGLNVPSEGHNRLCNSRLAPPGPEHQCDCYMRRYIPPLDALARLTAALKNAEDRTRASDHVREKWQSRAETAEQRVAELEMALRKIRDLKSDGGTYDVTWGPGGWGAVFQQIARVALGEGGEN